MERRLATAALIAALALTAAQPALAQDGWGWSTIIPSVTGTDALGTYFWNERHKADAGSVSRRSAAGTPPAASLSTPPTRESLRFVPSTERRRASFARFLAERRGDAATRQQLEALISDPAFMPKVGAEFAKIGLRPDNVADAYTVWWIAAWQAAHGQSRDPSPASVRAVKAQAEKVFLAVPSVTGADDATKQAFAEGLLVQAVVMSAVTEQTAGDPMGRRTIGQLARGSAGRFGLDLDAVTLTDAGFVEARG